MRGVYVRFLAHFDRSGSDAEFDRLNGPPLIEVIADLARTHGIALPTASLLIIYREMVEDAYRNVAPCPGAADLLQTARQSGIPVAIVTSNYASLTWAWLRVVGLEEMVDVVIGGDEVQCGKPDPEPYLTALQRTGCERSLSLAVEDSATGARSAAAAGIPTLLLSSSSMETPTTAVVIDCLDRVAKIIHGRRPLGKAAR
jgi:HAD superfamily hydrolase (TIGR01509 family)